MLELRPYLLFLHILLIIIWLGTDVIVFMLSMSILNRALPIAIRIDRAHIAELIDRGVLIAFLATMPVGILLVHIGGYSPFETEWLSRKLIFFGIILLMAVTLLTGAAATRQTLEKIGAGDGNAETLERSLRRNVLGLAVPVLILYSCILAILFIALKR